MSPCGRLPRIRCIKSAALLSLFLSLHTILVPVLARVLGRIPGPPIDKQIHRYHVNWSNVTAISKTTATLQVVSNPVLNRKVSPVAKRLFETLHDLQADMVRYVPWFPYPHFAVAELEPPNPTTKTTSWNFNDELQQQFLDTFYAVTTTKDPVSSKDASNGNGIHSSQSINSKSSSQSKRVVINFSTQPTWMFNTTDWSYGSDPNRAEGYCRGNWKNGTTQLVADYYGRLAEWMILGSFEDEFGMRYHNGPGLGESVTHWEIFNEVEAEHSLTWQQYNVLFDAIVRAIRRKADPHSKVRFMGLALEGHREWEYWTGFLNLTNHAPDVRDAVASGYVSFHWYAHTSSRTNVSTFEEPFAQIPSFLQEVSQIIFLRDQLSPTTQLAVNEVGVIPPGDNNPTAPPSPPIYYNMVAAFDTVLVSELSRMGIEVVGASQFCGCPAIPSWQIPTPQFPGVSMTNWTTGEGNPRYWALKLYLDYFGPGDKIVHTAPLSLADENSIPETKIYVQGRITHRGNKYVLIVVNQTNEKQQLQMRGLKGSHLSVVDESTHDSEWKSFTLNSDVLFLSRFAVAIVHVTKTAADLVLTEQ